MDLNQLPSPGQYQSPAPQSPQPTQPGGQFDPTQYDFITSSVKPPKKTLLPTQGSSKKQRLLIVAVGLLVLFIVAILFYSLLTSGQKSNTEQLKGVLVKQTELSRVSTIGKNKASGEQAKAIASMTDIIMVSQSAKLRNVLAQQKIKLSEKELSGSKNAETDQTLTTAEKNGRFDDAFIQALRTELEAYKKNLKSAYDGSKSKAVRETLNEDYGQVNLLLEDITGSPQT